MQATAVPIYPAEKPVGTGGFLDPERIVDQLDLRDGMRVADFGSGAGYFTLLIAERVGSDGRVYALDILEDALDSVRAKARLNNLSNIETIRTNLEVVGSSSLNSESQDMVMLANLLFQSNNRDPIITEAARITRKGGTVVIMDWKKGTGGFGPPDSFRVDFGEIQKLCEAKGLNMQSQLNAGMFHFGLIFKKQ